MILHLCKQHNKELKIVVVMVWVWIHKGFAIKTNLVEGKIRFDCFLTIVLIYRRTTTMKNQRNVHQNGIANGKKELASVRGWLSEATNDWYPGQNKKGSSHRPLRHTSSVGVITTLGRSKETLTMDNPKRETKDMFLRTVDIPYEKKVKRTKSLWKFRKSDDILEGMALWKHRSLVDVSSLSAKDGTPLPAKKSLSLSKSLDDSQDNEDVSEETIVNGERKEMNNSTRRGSLETSESENDDSESCIVVDDHLKTAKAAPLLPRTRLIRNNTKRERAEPESRKSEMDMRRPQRTLDGRAQTVGDKQRQQQWFDPWDHE